MLRAAQHKYIERTPPVVEPASGVPLEFEQKELIYKAVSPLLFVVGVYVLVKKALCRLLLGRNPRTNCWFIDGMSINSRRVKDGARGWGALDAVYNFPSEGEGSGWIERAIDRFWLNVRNAQAVRNRLKIVKRELRKAILEIEAASGGEPVCILSLAAGSGQGVIETVSELKRKGIRCKVLLLDQDDSALTYARKLAQRYGVGDDVEVRHSDVVYFERDLLDFKPDIVEMCGLLDYLPTRLAVILIKKIHRRLKRDGFFLACHIHPNSEAFFLWHQENWGMLYRTRGQLRDLLVEGGFLEADLHTEPHRIHSVSVARRL